MAANPYDPTIDARVSKVEVSLETLHEQVAGITGDLRTLSTSINLGFADLRRESATGKQTNWGWIAAFAGVSVAVLGFLTTSLLQPLKTFDEGMSGRMDRVQERAEKAWEQEIRNDERLKFLERWHDSEFKQKTVLQAGGH